MRFLNKTETIIKDQLFLLINVECFPVFIVSSDILLIADYQVLTISFGPKNQNCD